MSSKLSILDVVAWKAVGHRDINSNNGFVTLVIGNSKTEFALYDSGYPPRMPIVVSSHATLELLGQEYVPIRQTNIWVEVVLYPVLYHVFPWKSKVLTLKSPPLISPERDKGPTGQIILTIKQPVYRRNISAIQDALNIHAQDIHSLYHNRNYGEIVISVAKIINSSANY